MQKIHIFYCSYLVDMIRLIEHNLSVQSPNSNDVTLRGVQFLIQTQENLTWLCFASEPITLTFDGTSKRTIRSVEKFTGVLRFALLPPPMEGDSIQRHGSQYENFPLSTSLGVKRLIYHAHTYPVGAKVSWDFQDLPASPSYKLMNSNKKDVINNVGAMLKGMTVGTVNFEYDTKSMHDDPNVRSSTVHNELLLMLALPHHAQVLPSNMILKDLDLRYQCIKGNMTPIIGGKWTYDEHLTNIGFDDEQSLRNLQSLDAKIKHKILDQVEKDLRIVLPTLTENVYGFGKQVARLAQLGHIASVLEAPRSDNNVTAGEPTKSLTHRATRLLHGYLSNFLDGINTDNLVYDVNFGGIITRNGLLNMQEDFGNGW